MIVVNEEKLSSVLSEFARTLITDFPIQGILDHLVERIVEVMPVTSAGVTLISAGMAPRYVAASDESALRFERLQTDLGEGPCISAYESGEAVSVADLRTDLRYPRFAPAAVTAGLAAVFTFPLRDGDGRLGALDLYCDSPGRLDDHDMDAAQTLADVTAAYLINAQSREAARVASDLYHHSALHDPLTRIPNRLLLQERLDHAVLRAKRSHTNTAILFADLDHFKQVNDTHGHRVGDALLFAVAQRLSSFVRSGDTLARFSGDEFVFLCEDLRDAADAALLAERVCEAFSAPFVLDGLELSVSASVGIAFAGPAEAISSELLARADMAMYEVKRSGGAGREIVDLRSVFVNHDENRLEADLRKALAHDSLDVVYQPIVRTADGGVVGVEALLRWDHPERGAIAPQLIVALAERIDLIDELGAWVLERSCRDHGSWMRQHPGTPLYLAVNVSGRQLLSPGLFTAVSKVLSADMDPGSLILELTETIFIEDNARTLMVLGDLRRLGVRLALDDFGSGYSSLTYLARLSLDIVKIDRGFVANIGHDPTNRAIVVAIMNLAHILGLAVVAEGVETRRQCDEVTATGCEYAQGYFYATPLSASEIGPLIGARLGLVSALSPVSLSVIPTAS
ncbi:MAG: GGDEF domain-containing protein [Ilumatobacteraceae bacterium]